jgi:hypothetical protein
MQKRVSTANQCLLAITDEGHTAFSPLSYFPMFAPALPDKPYEFWLAHCLQFLANCDRIVVIPIPGWRESKGVAVELQYAIMAQKLIGCFKDSRMAEAGLIENLTPAEFEEALGVIVNPSPSLILPESATSNIIPISSARKQ